MSTRDRTLLGLLAVVALLAAYWFLLIAPQRDEAARLDDQIAVTRSAVAAARRDVVQGRRAKQEFPRTYAALVELGKAVPEDDGIRTLVVQLDAAAARTRVDFRDIKVTGGSATPLPVATGPVPATQAAAATAPPGAVVGPAGLSTYPLTLKFRGSYFELAALLSELEDAVRAEDATLEIDGRLLGVDAVTLDPTQRGWPEVDADIAATAFLVPETEGLVAGATPQGPAGTTTPVVQGP